ncbi:MAG TPA: PP2C family protein-serine/threonine phosphatase, partial [Terriglobales bacterium]
HGTRMGGDFYHFMRTTPQRVVFGLLDVAGQRTENQHIISATRTAFQEADLARLGDTDVNEADAMMELCLQLNRTILKAADGVRACPAFAGCYHENLGLISYFNAGHTPGLVRDQSGVSELPATGLPLGLFSHALFNASIVAIEPGAKLLLASRGVVEGKCKSEEFGLNRVKETLHRSQSPTAKELCATVLDEVEKFICAPPTHDDVTALALLRHP